jgi:hypothetical protein
MRVHCCEFCLTDFEVRPQVKRPRACQKPKCQEKRQRLNEREWRVRHPGLYDAKYHGVMRERRTRAIQSIVIVFEKCIQIGVSLAGVDLKLAEFVLVFEKFLLSLGVRQINKFWTIDNLQNFAGLAIGSNQT